MVRNSRLGRGWSSSPLGRSAGRPPGTGTDADGTARWPGLDVDESMNRARSLVMMWARVALIIGVAGCTSSGVYVQCTTRTVCIGFNSRSATL